MRLNEIVNVIIGSKNVSLRMLVLLAKLKRSKKIVSIVRKSIGPNTEESGKEPLYKELQCIYAFIHENKPKDNEIAFLILYYLFMHTKVNDVNKMLDEEGFESIENDRIRYINTWIHSLTNILTYMELGIKKYKVLTCGDGSVCSKCAKHDHRIYYVHKAKIGKNTPPFCNKCRCVLNAVFDY